MHLSPRLMAVARSVKAGNVIADIGADHAALSCYLVESKITPRAIIGELTDGPCQRAREEVARAGLRDWIEVRQGDGLAVIKSGEIQTAVIAGMGGNTICGILDRSAYLVPEITQIVLQPMNRIPEVRQMAADRGWKIIDEGAVWDKDYYLYLVLSPGEQQPYELSPKELELGPVLILKNNQPDTIQYFRWLYDKYLRIVRGIPDYAGDRALNERARYSRMCQWIKEVLECA